MEPFGRRLGTPIGDRLDEDRGIVVLGLVEGGTEGLASVPRSDGEGADVVLATAPDRRHEVGEGMKGVLSLSLPLLAEGVDATELLRPRLVGVEEDVVALGIGGEEAVHAAGLKAPLGNDAIEQMEGILVELTGLGSDHHVIEDRRKLSLQFPGLEEGRPIDVGNEFRKRYRVEAADSQKRRHVDRRRRPVGRPALRPGVGQRHERRLLPPLEVFHVACLGGTVVAGEALPAGRIDELLHDAGRPRRVEHMDDVTGVLRGDLHRRVPGGRRGPADEDRQRQPLALELFSDVHHFLEARRDQPGEADDVDLRCPGRLEDLRRRDHHAEVDHLVAVAAKHHADDVLADVVNVAAHRGHEHPPAGCLLLPLLLSLHEWLEVFDRPLHHPCALHHLRQEHLPLPEQVADDLHPTHERALDDFEARGILPPRLLDIGLDVVGDPLEEGVLETCLDVEVAPGVGLGSVAGVTVLHLLGKLDQPVGGVGAAVEEDILDPLEELRIDLLIDGQLPRIDDPHLHPGTDGVVEEGGVHRLADGVIATEGEGDVAHPPRHLHQRHRLLDQPRGLDEVDGVAVVFLDTGGDGEDVGVEDDVLRRESGLLGEEPVGPLADRHFALDFGRLPLLVEGHDDDGGAVATDRPRLPEEVLLPLFQADGVDDPLALEALETCLEHLPVGAVDHHRNPGNLRLTREEREELRHHRRAVEHPLVDIDVDDVGAALHLLPGDADGLLVTLFADEPGEGLRAGDVRPFADDREAALGTDLEHLEPRIARALGIDRGDTRRMFAHRLGDRLDVRRRRTAAAADDVEPSLAGEFPEHPRHRGWRLVEATEGVGEPGVGVAADGERCDSTEIGQVGAQLLGTEGAVDSDAHQIGVGEAHPTGFDRLCGEGSSPLEDRERGHHRHADTGRAEGLLDGEQAGFEDEGVEGCLGEDDVDVPLEECFDLRPVVGHHLVVGDVAVARVVDVAGDRKLLVGRSDRPGYETRSVGRLRGGGVGGLAGEFGRGEVQFPHPVFEAEVCQGKGGGAEGVGLDDVGSGLEIGRVDPADRIPLGEDEDVDAVLQVLRVVAEGFAPETVFVETEGMDHRPHGAVENGDAGGEEVMEGLLADVTGERGHDGVGDEKPPGLWCGGRGTFPDAS